MNIRFTSTLTHEDENRLAPALLKAVAALLEAFPVAYSIRVETIDGRTFMQSGSSPSAQGLEAGEIDLQQPPRFGPTYES